MSEPGSNTAANDGVRVTWPAPSQASIIDVATEAELNKAWRVRQEVFVAEQRVDPDEEIDAADTAATTSHLLAIDTDGEPLATARVLTDQGEPGVMRIGRMAVRKMARGHGIGSAIVRACHELGLRQYGVDNHGAWADVPHDCIRRGCQRQILAKIAAQDHAIGFYSGLGYQVSSADRYLDAGIWHWDMEYLITEPLDAAAEPDAPATTPQDEDVRPEPLPGTRAARRRERERAEAERHAGGGE